MYGTTEIPPLVETLDEIRRELGATVMIGALAGRPTGWCDSASPSKVRSVGSVESRSRPTSRGRESGRISWRPSRRPHRPRCGDSNSAPGRRARKPDAVRTTRLPGVLSNGRFRRGGTCSHGKGPRLSPPARRARGRPAEPPPRRLNDVLIVTDREHLVSFESSQVERSNVGTNDFVRTHR